MAQSTATTFDLLIGRAVDGTYPVTVIASPAGETETAVMARLTPDDDEIRETLEQIEDRDTDAQILQWLGGEFFDQLFTGQIAALYRASMAITQGQGQRLRIRLRVDTDAPELVTLPWELLYDSTADMVLAASPDIDFVRHFPVRKPSKSTTVQLPLRVLVAISNPEGVPPLDVAKERAIIQEAIERQKEPASMVLHVVEHATPAALADALRSFDPHIFHFIGHGINDGTQGFTVLEDETGQPALVDDRAFREIFAHGTETRLVVLNACQSATVVGSKSLNGLAPSLLQRRISAVVAMQYAVADVTATLFAREFYRSLAAGLPVDEAVSAARRAIYVEVGRESADWATPVLYLRAKDGILFELETPELSAPSPIPPPPPPATPPDFPNFVGRTLEIAEYGQMLTEQGIAVIAGMPGVGKSAVAARVVAEWAAPSRPAPPNGPKEPGRIFWHTFRPDEKVEAIVWKLAGFLAWHGRPEVWEMLQGLVLAGGQLPPTDVLLDYIFQSIKGQGYLLCLDDFHHVEGDRLWDALADRLRAQVLAGEVRLLIVSGRIPDFVKVTRHKPLTGLSVADSRLLLAQRDVTLDAAHFAKLYDRTAGNAELLTLAGDALRDSPEPDRIIDRLAASADVERFLLDQVDRDLAEDEKLVMSGIAVLLGHPGSRDAIEDVLDGQNVRRTLTLLTNRFLLREDDAHPDRTYAQHAIVQAFYYDLLSRRERRAMHARAAEWYHHEEADDLRAARHYFHAGQPDQAAKLATGDVWAQINSGHSQSLGDLLAQFETRQLEPDLWLEVKLAQGKLHGFWGETEAGQGFFEDVLAQTPTPSQRVRALRGLGELLQQADPEAALDWLQQGLDLNAGADPEQEAALRIAIGTIHMWLGSFDEAAENLQAGLDLLSAGPSQLRATALENLGVVAAQGQGEMARGIALTQEALAISRRLHDHFKTAEILSTLGAYRNMAGDGDGALAELHQALALAQQIGSEKLLAAVEINLGSVGLDGDPESYAEVQGHLERGLALARKTGQSVFESIGLTNLAELMIRQEAWTTAGDYLTEAETLATALGNQLVFPVIRQGWAQIYLAQGDFQAALAEATQAVALCRETGEALELGIALRILGEAYRANHQPQAAVTAFAESVTVLGEDYPQELARTQAKMGLDE